MSDRSSGSRPSRGRSDRNSKPGKSTGRSTSGRSRSGDDRDDERGPRPARKEDEREGKPRSGRAGKRPPAAGRGRTEGSGTARPASSRAGKRPPASGRGRGRADEAGSDRSASGRPGKRPPAPGRHTADSGRRTAPGTGPGPSSEGRPSREGGRAFGKDRRDEGARAPRNTKYAGRPTGRGQDRLSTRGRKAEEGSDDGRIRLNRYLAQSGVASRREADDLIKAGVVQVNGVVVTEMGTKVSPTDKIHYGGQRLSMEKKRYVLLNKPKNFITTTDDPRDRRTVMALIDDACNERLYPVGRLDRNTTGVLLMTNDGDLAKKLSHPSHGAEKIYSVTLDKSVTKADLEKLVTGVHLDDGPATADEASYVVGKSKSEVGLKIHMGRNRVVRRMFEAMGYEVVKLDRVMFAGLTKKDLQRGKWRHLTEKEVLFLSKRK